MKGEWKRFLKNRMLAGIQTLSLDLLEAECASYLKIRFGIFYLICEVGQAFFDKWHEFLVFKEGFLDECEGESHGED